MYGKRHGYGVYYYADGSKYDGEWVDDKAPPLPVAHGHQWEGVGKGSRCPAGRSPAPVCGCVPLSRPIDNPTCCTIHCGPFFTLLPDPSGWGLRCVFESHHPGWKKGRSTPTDWPTTQPGTTDSEADFPPTRNRVLFRAPPPPMPPE